MDDSIRPEIFFAMTNCEGNSLSNAPQLSCFQDFLRGKDSLQGDSSSFHDMC